MEFMILGEGVYLNNFLDRLLDNISKYISITAFAGMIIVVVINVFTRAAFSKSLLFAEELSYLFFIYSVYFGVCVLYKRMGLISVDIVVNKLSPFTKRIIMSITFGLLLVVNVILLTFSWEMAIQSWERITPSLGIPYFYNYLSPTIAFFILAYYSLRFLIKEIKGEKVEEMPIEQQS